MNEQNKLFRMIQNESFAVYETALYLDGHEGDDKALEYMSVHNKKLKALTEEYERKYGPLTITSDSTSGWSWTKTPWPWEYGSV